MEKNTGNIANQEIPIVTCADRIKVFKTDQFKDFTSETEIFYFQPGLVIIKAIIRNKHRDIVSTGHSACKESDLDVFHVKYIETAETSAISRALAFLGIELRDTVAGAEEMKDAEESIKESSKKKKIAIAQKGVAEAIDLTTKTLTS